MNMRIIGCLVLASTGLLGACSQEQEDRAAQRSADAIHKSNQALREITDKARAGSEKVVSTAKEGAREAGALLSDGAITARVKAALVADPAVDASRIDVDTHGSVVTLTGRLEDATQTERALQIARGIEGVKSVESKLELRREG